MIRRLRRRMTLLVLLAVVLVTLGIIAAISFVNYSGIERQAEQTLAALAANGGRRFAGPAAMPSGGEPLPGPEPEESEAEPEGTSDDRQSAGRGPRDRRTQLRGVRAPEEGRRRRGFFARMSDEETVSLSNTITVLLKEDGTMDSWESDRRSLYDGEEIRAFCAEAASAGKESGRIGDRFYLKGMRGTRPILVVLDARLEMESARRVALITAGVGAVSCLLLGIGAWFLVRRMTQPVEEALLRQQRFVQDAGHEMKTPLAVITSHAQVLEGEYGGSESVTAILDEVKRTSGLVSQLLALSRLDREEETIRKQPFDLGRVAVEAALSYESAAFEAGFALETDADKEVTALGDGAMTRRVLMILLDNAVKYGESGTAIRVSVRKRGRNAILSVENEGPGIPPEAVPHLFERFYRADAAHGRGKDGSGLGLSIARELALAMGGEIACESGGGRTVFTLILTAK